MHTLVSHTRFRSGTLFGRNVARNVAVVCGAALVIGACERGEGADAEEAAAAANAIAAQSEIEYLTPFGPPVNPFSPAVRVGKMLYLSGQIGTDSTGALVAGGIEAETRQTMDNIKQVLSLTGSSMDRVVKCSAFLSDMREWPAMNAIYKTYFPVNKPARSALGATALALGARVEIECMAVANP